MTLLAALLAFAIAAVVTLVEFLSSNYPRTFSFLRRCPYLYAYATIYGLIALGALFGLDALTSGGTLKLQGLGLSSIWVKAIVLGLSTKALLHIRLYTATVGTTSFPLGVETIVQLFEPWLVRTITLDEWNSVAQYIEPRAARYTKLLEVTQKMKNNLPSQIPDAEKAAFGLDLEKATTVEQAMESYVRFVGRRTFERIFP